MSEITTNAFGYESDADYHTQTADMMRIGSSKLREYAENPFLFYRRYIERTAPEPESKAAYDVGHAVEALVFGWGEQIMCSNMKTAASKAHKECRDANPENIVLTESDYDLSHQLADEFFRSPYATIVTDNDGKAQYAGRIRMEHYYLQCKHDWWLPERNLVYDFKTVRQMAEFEKQVVNFGYIEQAALYQIIHNEITGQIPDWGWIVVEKEWPREVKVFFPNEDWLITARKKVRGWIAYLHRDFDADWNRFRNRIVQCETLYQPPYYQET